MRTGHLTLLLQNQPPTPICPQRFCPSGRLCRHPGINVTSHRFSDVRGICALKISTRSVCSFVPDRAAHEDGRNEKPEELSTVCASFRPPINSTSPSLTVTAVLTWRLISVGEPVTPLAVGLKLEICPSMARLILPLPSTFGSTSTMTPEGR